MRLRVETLLFFVFCFFLKSYFMPHSACLKMLTTSRGCFSATRLDGFEKKRKKELQQIGKERLVLCGDRAADYLFILRDWNWINLGMYQSGERDKKGNSTFWIGNLWWTMCVFSWLWVRLGGGAETTSLAVSPASLGGNCGDSVTENMDCFLFIEEIWGGLK